MDAPSFLFCIRDANKNIRFLTHFVFWGDGNSATIYFFLFLTDYIRGEKNPHYHVMGNFPRAPCTTRAAANALKSALMARG